MIDLICPNCGHFVSAHVRVPHQPETGRCGNCGTCADQWVDPPDSATLQAELAALQDREWRMRAVLQQFAAMDVDYDADPCGPDYWYCLFCEARKRVIFNCGKVMNTAEPFEHDADCPMMAARALLAEGEASDGE